MDPKTQRICKYCRSVLTEDMIYGTVAICRNCGMSNEKKRISVAPIAMMVVFVGILGIGAWWLTKKPSLEGLTEDQTLAYAKRCPHESQPNECILLVFEHLAQLDPNNTTYQANYAFHLTTAKQYEQADLIYSKILAGGEGTYDLMAYYGKNLQGLGRNEEAIKWYEKALGLQGSMLDITQNLALAYVQSGRVFEAISLLQSFIMNHPNAEGRLAGNISASLELVEKSSQQKDVATLNLVGIGKGHFAVPLKLGEKAQTQVFMLDTGASSITVPTEDAKKYFPEIMGKAILGRAVLADGREIKAHKLTLPKLYLGPWEFDNIDVLYCDSCSRLAGMSLFKHIKMEMDGRGQFYTMKLTR